MRLVVRLESIRFAKLIIPMKHTLLTLAVLAFLNVNGFGQKLDTLIRSIQPVNLIIPDASKSTQAIRFPGYLLPYFSKLEDVDIYLDIEHESVNDLEITIYAPLNHKATVMKENSCSGLLGQNQGDVKVTLNDQVYNINVYNATGQKVAAHYTCSSVKPRVGDFNQGHMLPHGDQLSVFNSVDWILGGQCGVHFLLPVQGILVDESTNNFSGIAVQSFLEESGFLPNDRILLTYKSAKGGLLQGLQINQAYLFLVINYNTIELLTITGSDITAVPPGSKHEFVFQRDWLVVVEDTRIDGGGKINEIALKLAIVEEPCAPQKVDDMENLTTDPEAEVRDGWDNGQLTFYPNPFTDWLNLDWSGDNQEGKLTIYRIDGQVVFGPAVLGTIKDISSADWTSGMYMAEWKGDTDTKRTLLVKQ